MDLGHKALFRNTVLNLFGLAVPLAVGFVAIPLVVRALGNERFGILSLVWVVFGYFGLFDLGLGRTTTKYIAAALGRNESGQLPGTLWTTVLLQTAVGLLAALLSYLAAPLIVRRLLNIPPGYIGETILTLRLVGLSLPVMFVSSSFRGVLEAAQRFDLVNAVKVPVNVLFYILPLAGVALGLKLPGIVLLLVASRIAGLVLWARLSFSVLPPLRTKPAFHAGLVRALFSFSGWIGLSSILFAVTTSIDRLIIGAVITVEAVAFYSAPYEAINRVGVIPGSLGMVLFPAFSYLDAGRKGTEAESLFARSTKLLLLTTGPVFILLVFFARDFLRLWLGPDYAAAATFVVQVLAAGFFVNTVFAVPNNYLQGIGRADIAPKYQVVELVVYGALAWGGAKLWGIKGVALATALRLAAFTLVLWAASFRTGRVRFGFVWRNGLGAVLAGLGLLALGLGASALLGFGLWGAGALSAAFAAGAWRWLLDDEEKALLGGLLRRGRTARETEGRPPFGDSPAEGRG